MELGWLNLADITIGMMDDWWLKTWKESCYFHLILIIIERRRWGHFIIFFFRRTNVRMRIIAEFEACGKFDKVRVKLDREESHIIVPYTVNVVGAIKVGTLEFSNE